MWRGQRLKNLLWRAAIAYQKNEYTIAIDLLKMECKDGRVYLDEIGERCGLGHISRAILNVTCYVIIFAKLGTGTFLN